jgi:hypothetical protein
MSNVYHFHADPLQAFLDNDAINEVVAAERAIHSTAVEFISARTWGPTDQGPVASVTREIVDLDGVGSLTAGIVYKELAWLFVWPLGRYGTKNRPQYLRKWIRPQTTSFMSGGEFSGSDEIAVATRQQLVDLYAGVVTEVGTTEAYDLCTESDRLPIGPPTMFPYLEHRQLGR